MIFGVSTIAFIVFCAIFFLTLAAFILIDYYNMKKNTKKKHRKDEWLFDRWAQKLYSVFFKKKDPAVIAKKLGLDSAKYLHNCDVAMMEPELDGVVIKKLLGIFVLIVGGMVGILVKNMYIAFAAMMVGFAIYTFSTYKAESLAKKRKQQVVEELPRFADMLQMALCINLPVEKAIIVTSKYLPGTVLAEEFINSATEMEIGTIPWKETLKKIALKYELNDLSDFVLSIVTAYEKGIPIYTTVATKAKELRQSRMFQMRERAGKLNATVLIPIAIFKLLPLIAIMGVPIVVQLKSNGL